NRAVAGSRSRLANSSRFAAASAPRRPMLIEQSSTYTTDWPRAATPKKVVEGPSGAPPPPPWPSPGNPLAGNPGSAGPTACPPIATGITIGDPRFGRLGTVGSWSSPGASFGPGSGAGSADVYNADVYKM